MKKTLRNLVLIGMLGLGLTFSSCFFDDYSNNNPLKHDGHYPGVVIFCYHNKKISVKNIQERFNEFIQDTEEPIVDNESYFSDESGNRLVYESIEKWFDREAEKYNQKIDIPLSLYPEQIKIPKKFIDYSKEYPIDIYKLSSYIRYNYPETNGYDFIAFLYSDDEAWENFNPKYEGYAGLGFRSIFVRNAYNEEYEKGELGRKNRIFAHEFLHLLGATDKYGSEYNGIYENCDIMRNLSCRFNETIKITEPTASEIGWIKD